MESTVVVRKAARHDSNTRELRDLARKVFVVGVVFVIGCFTGVQWLARYFATHFEIGQFVRPEDQQAFVRIQEATQYWWVGMLIGLGALCFFLSMYRVTRHDGR